MDAGGPQPSFAPPGWVIGAVWVGLFVAMSVARWRLHPHPGPRRWVTALLVACLLYPWYALATGSLPAGFVGNLVTLALAVGTVAVAWPRSRLAAGLVVPVAGWLLFAGGLTAVELGLVG